MSLKLEPSVGSGQSKSWAANQVRQGSKGLRSNTTPRGAYLEALNPLTITLGVQNVSFVAQAVDWIPEVLYEIIAAACSSPQTTEINAATRADTLMKWVNLGIAQAVVFVVAAVSVLRFATNSANDRLMHNLREISIGGASTVDTEAFEHLPAAW
mgnify:CR=1 FL=1